MLLHETSSSRDLFSRWRQIECDKEKEYWNNVWQLIIKKIKSIPWSESWHALFVAVSCGVSKTLTKQVKSDKIFVFPLCLHRKQFKSIKHETKNTIVFETFEEMWPWISCKLIHSYKPGGQNTLEYIIDIKIPVKNITTPRDKQYILAYNSLKAHILCNINKPPYKYIHVTEKETTIILCACLHSSLFCDPDNIWKFLPVFATHWRPGSVKTV